MAERNLLRVIFPTHEFAPKRGGISTYIEETARALSSTNLVEVGVWQGGLKAINDFGFEVRHVNNRGSLNWPCLWKMGRFLRERADSVRSSTLCLAEPGPLFTYLYCGVLCLPWPRCLVLVLHGSEILRLASFPHRRRGFRRLLRKADKIGVVSDFTRRLLERHFPGFLDKVVLVPGALRSDFATPIAQSRNSDPPARLRVLTVARMHPRKGFHHVIRALGQLPTTLREKVSYKVVAPDGGQVYRSKLQKLANDCGVGLEISEDNGRLKEMYAEADVFAMTSDSLRKSVEGFGLVYLEAGAFGLPVVAFDTGGVGEAVRDGETGLLISPGDIAALSAALRSLIEDPELRRRLGAAGKMRVRELSWRENVEKLFTEELRQ